MLDVHACGSKLFIDFMPLNVMESGENQMPFGIEQPREVIGDGIYHSIGEVGHKAIEGTSKGGRASQHPMSSISQLVLYCVFPRQFNGPGIDIHPGYKGDSHAGGSQSENTRTAADVQQASAWQ